MAGKLVHASLLARNNDSSQSRLHNFLWAKNTQICKLDEKVTSICREYITYGICRPTQGLQRDDELIFSTLLFMSKNDLNHHRINCSLKVEYSVAIKIVSSPSNSRPNSFSHRSLSHHPHPPTMLAAQTFHPSPSRICCVANLFISKLNAENNAATE